MWVKYSENKCMCVCIFLYVFECLKPKRQKELNVLITYGQISQKYKKKIISFGIFIQKQKYICVLACFLGFNN